MVPCALTLQESTWSMAKYTLPDTKVGRERCCGLFQAQWDLFTTAAAEKKD